VRRRDALRSHFKARQGAFETWPASFLLALGFTFAFAAKRPSQIFHAQLFAEDGTVFLADALAHGWRDLWSPRVGYLELFPRIASHLVVSFDMLYWPLVANLAALAATFALFFYAMRRSVPLSERLGQGALICLVPFGSAIYANMTYFVVVPLLFYPLVLRDVERTCRVARAHYVFLALIATTGPWGLFFFPVPIVLWLARRRVEGAAVFAAAHGLVFGVAAAALLTSAASAAPVRALPSLGTVAWLAYDVMRGLFAVRRETMGMPAPVLTAVGTICVMFCLFQAARRRPPLLLASLASGVAILAGGLWRTMATSTASPPPAPWGAGERYFVLLLSTICMLVLVALSDAGRGRRAPAATTPAALALALIVLNGLVNYSRPGLPDFNWAGEVERSRTEQVKEIQIPPGGGWTIRLP
jgi:hypothetical protein